jgi:hypothetical protein
MIPTKNHPSFRAESATRGIPLAVSVAQAFLPVLRASATPGVF